MPLINLPYGNRTLNSDDLKKHIRGTGNDYIIQGQKACSRSVHPKPHSLDCWLRDNYSQNPDEKQAVNEVMEALIDTGDFVEGRFTCPVSGRKCKGVRIK